MDPLAFVTGNVVPLLPLLLVYFVAFVLALIYFGRAPLPSLLTLAAVFLLTATMLLTTGLQYWLIQAREASGDYRDFAMKMAVMNIVTSIVRAIGAGLLVAAVFVGRGRRPAGNTGPQFPPKGISQ